MTIASSRAKRCLVKFLCVFSVLAFLPYCLSSPVNEVDPLLSIHPAGNALLTAEEGEVAAASSKTEVELGFGHAFIKAIGIIIVSELGDKTFFIAAIFAMKHARATVFAGAITALGLMTFLSVAIGFAMMIIPRTYTFYGSVGLFVIFGLKMLHEGYTMDPNDKEELNEVEDELKKKDEELEQAQNIVKDVESGVVTSVTFRQRVFGLCSPILLQSFTMTFLAEWGDRSQITTIILGASEDALGVFLGAVIGHALCTGFAVLGGRMIAQRISVRTVTIIGGVFFICNAIYSAASGSGIE